MSFPIIMILILENKFLNRGLLMRNNGRKNNELRKIDFHLNYTKNAEGSVLAIFGDTKVLCNVSIEPGVPRWMRKEGQGWVTAEYAMLPRSTNTRNIRESSRGKQSGRTHEIQRLIGRSMRGATNLAALGERTIIIDCDVIQADGGTRTAAISGAYLALKIGIKDLMEKNKIDVDPLPRYLGAISVGIFEGTPILDLDYHEDSQAETDMNIIMDDAANFIEIQGTAESKAFKKSELEIMLELADKGIKEIIEIQRNLFNKHM